MAQEIRVTVWNEFRHEQKADHKASKVYPDGMHAAIAAGLSGRAGLSVRTATLDQDDQGLPQEVLDGTDVLLWWGHCAHNEVQDAVVDRVQQRVLDGMGLIPLHSAHMSKIFRRMMGTSCLLCWREAEEKERLWVANPHHPITRGLGPYFELPETEMYGEFFDIPEPDKVLFISWFQGGEVFRSGATWTRGKGKIFYFRPGHETHPIYFDKTVLHVLENAVRWAAFAGNPKVSATGENVAPLEKLPGKG